MSEAIAFAERYPKDRQTVTVFCEHWLHPKVMEFRADFAGAPRLLCAADGRNYWYPERMTWRPHFEVAKCLREASRDKKEKS